jgi:hypothetical protein
MEQPHRVVGVSETALRFPPIGFSSLLFEERMLKCAERAADMTHS